MTIEELQDAYNAIPPDSPANRARRAEILKKIAKLQREQAGK